MKKTKVLILILSVAFAYSFLAKKTCAQDKWEIKSVTCPTSCKINAKNLTFKVKIKNIGNVISIGDRITINVAITHNGNNLGGGEVDFTQGVRNIGIGKTTTLNVLCTNENFRQFTSEKGTKTLNVNFQGSSGNNMWNGFGSSMIIKVK